MQKSTNLRRGRGCFFPSFNIFVGRFWRTLKYEEVYCTAYEDTQDHFQFEI